MLSFCPSYMLCFFYYQIPQFVFTKLTSYPFELIIHKLFILAILFHVYNNSADTDFHHYLSFLHTTCITKFHFYTTSLSGVKSGCISWSTFSPLQLYAQPHLLILAFEDCCEDPFVSLLQFGLEHFPPTLSHNLSIVFCEKSSLLFIRNAPYLSPNMNSITLSAFKICIHSYLSMLLFIRPCINQFLFKDRSVSMPFTIELV